MDTISLQVVFVWEGNTEQSARASNRLPSHPLLTKEALKELGTPAVQEQGRTNAGTLRAAVAQEVERVGWEPEGSQFDPWLLLDNQVVPELDASPQPLLASCLSPCVVYTAGGV